MIKTDQILWSVTSRDIPTRLRVDSVKWVEDGEDSYYEVALTPIDSGGRDALSRSIASSLAHVAMYPKDHKFYTLGNIFYTKQEAVQLAIKWLREKKDHCERRLAEIDGLLEVVDTMLETEEGTEQ